MKSLLLSAFALAWSGCGDSGAPSEPDPARSSEETTPEPDDADEGEEAEAADESTGEDALTDNVDETLFFFQDGCKRAEGDTAEEAVAACRERRRSGDGWERRFCRCDLSAVVEVRTNDPVAFWAVNACPWFRGPTPEAAREHCLHPEPDFHPDHGCSCDQDDIGPVRGPYERSVAPREFESIDEHIYLTERRTWVDEQGTAPCFVAGTLVRSRSGGRPIETLQAGDEVLAFDLESTEFVWATVLRTHVKDADETEHLVLEDGTAIGTTPNHPFYLHEQSLWVPAGELMPRQHLLTLVDRELAPIAIRTIEFQQHNVTVYNLSVSGPENYFANGVLVHNY